MWPPWVERSKGAGLPLEEGFPWGAGLVYEGPQPDPLGDGIGLKTGDSLFDLIFPAGIREKCEDFSGIGRMEEGIS